LFRTRTSNQPNKNIPLKEVTTPNLPPETFKFVVESIFTIKGRGTTLTGKIESGAAQTGQTINIKTPSGETLTSTIAGIEAFRKQLTQASAGESVGLVVQNLGKDQIPKDSVITGLV
jgi:elongation factor Tu